MLDDGLIVHYPAPRSYTGETVVELQTHGGPLVAEHVLAATIGAGARAAGPGEFTARAVLNGKLTLIEAEAIGDLIDARSRASHRMALAQLSGALGARYARLREGIIELEALLAYDIDFPEEDPGRLPHERILGTASTLIGEIEHLLATAPAAILGRDGATVVLAGPPNAGKSSLLNALIGEARVIVSEEPGTTRDAVEVLLEQDPWPLRLVDTAGLRENAGAIEQAGIEITERYLGKAEAVIACAEQIEELRAIMARLRNKTNAPVVGALTKRDLQDETRLHEGVIGVSAVDGRGLTTLLEHVTRAVRDRTRVPDDGSPVVARVRQRVALEEARDELRLFHEAWSVAGLPAPVAATHVRAATHALDELIGAVDLDDVFARVFSTFCVGK